ncbi:hypothetical protein HBI79_144280 [Parastagonospora nodorum]|nr:hypothetical protein HBI79_144280 [Parastagonospora nodorum]
MQAGTKGQERRRTVAHMLLQCKTHKNPRNQTLGNLSRRHKPEAAIPRDPGSLDGAGKHIQIVIYRRDVAQRETNNGSAVVRMCTRCKLARCRIEAVLGIEHKSDLNILAGSRRSAPYVLL